MQNGGGSSSSPLGNSVKKKPIKVTKRAASSDIVIPEKNDPENKKKPPSKNDRQNDDDSAFYKPYHKPGYKRVFPENVAFSEYTVYVESTNADEKIGNRNPLMLANLFKNEIKGVVNIKRINATKIGVMFSQGINANSLLKNEDFLQKHQLKAYIPARAVETIGVLRFVPTSISNEELFKKLSSNYEIVEVRRFTRKVNGEIKPFTTVSLTFLTDTLPDYVYLDIFRFKVSEYNAPLLQCFKCFKFNHGAKICKSVQKCSICAAEHHYSECNNETELKCVNCGGQHLAISRDCPVKQKKIEEKVQRTNALSYAKALARNKQIDSENKLINYQKDFPDLKQPKTNPLVKLGYTKSSNEDTPKEMSKEQLIEEVIKSDFVLKGLIGALVTLGNGNDGKKLTTTVIKDILIKSLKNNG